MMKQKLIGVFILFLALLGSTYFFVAEKVYGQGVKVAQTSNPEPPQGRESNSEPPAGKGVECKLGTGRVLVDRECVCPAGLEPADPKNDDSKCQLSNPASGLLVDVRSFDELLKNWIYIALYFAGGVAVLFLIVGGFRYVTSLGNEEAMEKAKKNITSAVIGIIIIVMAFALVAIVNTLLTKKAPDQASPAGGGNSAGTDGTSASSSAGTGLQITSPPASRIFYFSVGGGGDTIEFFASDCPAPDCRWTFTSLPSWLHQVPSAGGHTLEGAVDPAFASEIGAGKPYTFTAQATNTKTGKSSPAQSYKIEVAPGPLNNP